MSHKKYVMLQVDAAINREIQTYGTLLHGDAKGANIVFNRDPYGHRKANPSAGDAEPLRCALYDLQYVGRGLLTHDLVYFLGTSVQSSLLTSTSEQELLETYLLYFNEGVAEEDRYEFDVLWKHWELSIMDWYRFMAGWGFWGNDRWVTRRARDIADLRIQVYV